jgi:hypothetical protein
MTTPQNITKIGDDGGDDKVCDDDDDDRGKDGYYDARRKMTIPTMKRIPIK